MRPASGPISGTLKSSSTAMMSVPMNSARNPKKTSACIEPGLRSRSTRFCPKTWASASSIRAGSCAIRASGRPLRQRAISRKMPQVITPRATSAQRYSASEPGISPTFQ